ncbi:poly-gamma-glutamate biosynthesis protein PgsC/CapC [Pseudoalteromonas piscicida]|uniref:poly-gamma-glutamate biosynthesis protein PgsC/CapC n=1 Tax=Pseudoalteromonas piscicida TaxID=43662 RepID=UPI0027E47983|nr:poly-gamma-glutamate biosynthesis protein PgsC/CapC [Pseudoalteromonas piscicida]WMO14426.1 poly-gamma-glutamate biosynthesis protein PgsC/CapC [Pseudoalteromonas piscicida]
MDWTLTLFPSAGGLGQSVITCVWIGIAVVAFFNLRFGFPLTGLVVPGYLVPLFIVSPTSAWVIIVEAIVVYGLMRFFAKTLVERLGYAEMFGRDRFFAIVLLSIIVRVTMDVLFWPLVAAYLTQWDITFDYAAQLYSLGLIIIALTANVMWNGGFKYGIKVTAIQLVVTYIIIRFGLMAFTNFSIANLAVMYEAVAASIIAAPKAYIILVITAFIASRANLKYGWEFNGIMLPALLALQLMQPTKLLTSFVETAIILVFGYVVLNFTRLKHANIEGARLMLLFFNIGFVYKLILNYVVVGYFPTLKVTDTFAFGYMLSTLLALKIYQKNALGLVIRATFQTSIVGGFIAICIGFAIMVIPSLFVQSNTLAINETASDLTLGQVISNYKSQLYTQNAANVNVSQYVTEQQRSHFKQAIRLLKQDSESHYVEAATLLRQADFSLQRTTQFLVIKDNQQDHKRGLFIINLTAQKAHIISVPYPTAERLASEAGGILFSYWQSQAMAFGNARPNQSGDKNGKQSEFYSDFFMAMDIPEVVQLREINRQVSQLMHQHSLKEDAQMWIFNSVPSSVQQSELATLFNINDAHFGLAANAPLPYSQFHGQMIEAYLSSDSYSSLLSAYGLQRIDKDIDKISTSDESIQALIEAFSSHISAKGSGAFSALSDTSAALWEYEVLRPLFAITQNLEIVTTPETLEVRLSQINRVANLLQYQLTLVENNQGQFVALSPLDTKSAYDLGQGVYFIALLAKPSLTIAVPRPLFESNTLEFSGQLFTATHAKLLAIAGAHPYTSIDANVMAADNVRSLFNVVYQSAQRYFYDNPLLNLQIRSHSAPASIRPSALAYQFTTPNPIHNNTIATLQRVLADLGVNTQTVSGQQATRGLELGTTPQSGYQLFAPKSELAALWLASDFKSHFAITNDALLQRLLAVAHTPRLKVIDLLALSPNDWHEASAQFIDALKVATGRYATTQHLPVLQALCQFESQCKISAFSTHRNGELGLMFTRDNALLALYLPRRNRVIDLATYAKAVHEGRYVLD